MPAAKRAAAPAPAARAAVNPFKKPDKKGGNFKFKLPDKLPDNGRGRIPKAKYIGRITDIVDAPSKTSGNDMWTWTAVITKGPYAGRDFKLWTVLTDDSAWKVIETLKALGHEFEPGDDIDISRQDVVGVGCTMHIKDDKGRDGDGEFSKLEKITAHPSGAGYRAGGGIASKAREEEDLTPIDDVEEGEEVDNIEELHETEEEDEQFSCPFDDCEFVGTGEEVDAHMVEEHPVEEEEEEEPEPEPAPPPRRSAAKKAAPAAAAKRPAAKKSSSRGAPATLGRGKR